MSGSGYEGSGWFNLWGGVNRGWDWVEGWDNGFQYVILGVERGRGEVV